MDLHNQLYHDRMKMLKWVSERNVHVPLSDLAFMLDLNDDMQIAGSNETSNGLYEYHLD
ncbi:MAG: hypothetical protein Q9M23_03085 [Mariprofundaceae bacterium]|nr:hypothetical protein [Mariprofundaceae bacterium]